MNICIFEDYYISKLAPINYLRHSSEIICGALTLKEKIETYFKPKSLTLYTRNYLAPVLKEKFRKIKVNEYPDNNCLFLNSRVIFNNELAKKILKYTKPVIICKGNDIIGIKTTKKNFNKVNEVFASKPAQSADFKNIPMDKAELKGEVKILNNPSDIIRYSGDEIDCDLANIFKNKKKLKIQPKCEISKQTVFNTSEGGIIIGKNTVIEPFCYIKGPVYIGNNCVIKAGTALYGPVTINNSCRVSGEITNSVLHSYVNKQHLGFLGHSYLCEWVNLGAGTTTSNLKNNYSNIILNSGGEKIDTNSIFLGSIIGDHTKTGINTMLNTGTIIGVSCNIYGGGYHGKTIKSFTWDDATTGRNVPYDFEKALNTARVSMKRRNVEMPREYGKMLKYVHDNISSVEKQ